MTTTEIAVANSASTAAEVARAAARSAIELSADQREWTPQQIAALKELGIDDAPAAVLDLFFHRCRTTGLDPFNKQIYLIGRKTKVGGYRGEPERWETKWTTQTGIDGFRLNGHKAAAKAGHKVRTEGPFWQSENGGGWSDVALFGKDENGRKLLPAVAKFIIWVNGEPFPGIAHYDEFVQTTGYGDNAKPNSMWSKMPANQIAKCAEAQAWRKAYPDDFSGLVLEDAAQIIDPDGSPVEPVRARAERVSAAEILAAPASDPVAKPDTSQVTAPAETSPDGGQADAPAPRRSTPGQHKEMLALLKAGGHSTRREQYAQMSEFTNRAIDAAADLTFDEAAAYLERLRSRQADHHPAPEAPQQATPEQLRALEYALENDNVTTDEERLAWVRKAVPDVGSLSDLTGDEAERMTKFLIDAQAADAAARAAAEGDQLPITEGA